ncbi:hypothetical protein JAAARDRAFT_322408 [Jaapia argillacea MUCL 33604]|uniref:Uncharacterized protein n=1 Tax=Jaapia argillacea MUCL 33604 TaxID=933084 RepID=A0A067PN13_9AGAM|nr:hypothetical protein JAAARDRAFT_322408 [Jaapia argillacea MUCL 33604]
MLDIMHMRRTLWISEAKRKSSSSTWVGNAFGVDRYPIKKGHSPTSCIKSRPSITSFISKLISTPPPQTTLLDRVSISTPLHHPTRSFHSIHSPNPVVFSPIRSVFDPISFIFNLVTSFSFTSISTSNIHISLSSSIYLSPSHLPSSTPTPSAPLQNTN